MDPVAGEAPSGAVDFVVDGLGFAELVADLGVRGPNPS